MRISDWSSDVCSSDLPGVALERQQHVVDELFGPADRADEHAALSFHQFRRRVSDHVSTKIHRALENRGCEGVVDDARDAMRLGEPAHRSEEHTSELQSLMRISYAVI